MWDFDTGKVENNRYLVLGFTLEPAADIDTLPTDELIASGPLLSDDGSRILGSALLLEAHDEHNARSVLSADRYVGTEVHLWRFGGRPT
jgi:hypothetical protein